MIEKIEQIAQSSQDFLIRSFFKALLFIGLPGIYILYINFIEPSMAREQQYKNIPVSYEFKPNSSQFSILRKDVYNNEAEKDRTESFYSFKLKPVFIGNTLKFELTGQSAQSKPNIIIYSTMAKIVANNEQIMANNTDNEKYTAITNPKDGTSTMTPVKIEFNSFKDLRWGVKLKNKEDLKIKSFTVIIPVSYPSTTDSEYYKAKFKPTIKDLTFIFSTR